MKQNFDFETFKQTQNKISYMEDVDKRNSYFKNFIYNRTEILTMINEEFLGKYLKYFDDVLLTRTLSEEFIEKHFYVLRHKHHFFKEYNFSVDFILQKLDELDATDCYYLRKNIYIKDKLEELNFDILLKLRGF